MNEQELKTLLAECAQALQAASNTLLYETGKKAPEYLDSLIRRANEASNS